MEGSARIEAVNGAKEQGGVALLESLKCLIAFPLLILLLAIALAVLPIIIYRLMRWTIRSIGLGTTTANTKGSDGRDDYARGYARGVEDMEAYRRRAEEAEREVERLRAGQQTDPPAGE